MWPDVALWGMIRGVLPRGLPIALGALALFGGCNAHGDRSLRQGGVPEYRVEVDALSDTAAAQQASYVLLPGNADADVSDLQYREHAAQVHRVLTTRKFNHASAPAEGQLAIFVSYGSGEPEISYAMASDPEHGLRPRPPLPQALPQPEPEPLPTQEAVTAPPAAVMAEPAAVMAEPAAVMAEPAAPPAQPTLQSYDLATAPAPDAAAPAPAPSHAPAPALAAEPLVELASPAFPFRDNSHYVRLSAIDLKRFRESGEVHEVWRVTVTTTGWDKDLRKAAPALFAATRNLIGTDTGGSVSLWIKDDDPRVEYVRGRRASPSLP